MTRLFVAITVLFLFAAESLAVNCHCFNNREFEPASPASADPYILATAASSLLVGSARSDKSLIVRKRMAGADEPDVWLGLQGAAVSGKSSGDFFSARDKHGSWAKAYEAMGLNPEKFGKAFAEALPRDEFVATRLLADMTLAAAFPTEKDMIAKLRGDGATTQEVAVSLFLKAAAAKDPIETLKKVKSGQTTWGTLLHDAGFSPKDMSKKMTALAKPLF